MSPAQDWTLIGAMGTAIAFLVAAIVPRIRKLEESAAALQVSNTQLEAKCAATEAELASVKRERELERQIWVSERERFQARLETSEADRLRQVEKAARHLAEAELRLREKEAEARRADGLERELSKATEPDGS